MNLEQLEKSAYSHHKATEAIVQKIVNTVSYTPVFFPIIVRKGEQVSCIVNASEQVAPNMDYVEAYITIGSFSLELKMKLLIFLESGNWVNGHKLMSLYESMTAESKDDVRLALADLTKNSEFHKLGSKAINENCKVQFSWSPHKLISNSSEAFEKWRYCFEEKGNVSWFAGYSELQQAFDARIRRLRETALTNSSTGRS
jgi:hypothetical protein